MSTEEELGRERRKTIVTWVIIGFLVALMFIRVGLGMMLYGNPPRTWQFRVSPQIPAQSYSSTQPVTGSVEVPPQVILTPREEKERKK
jgi:hypothetical protein